MKVWLDVANSPHVAFLWPFLRRLESEGASIIVTARDLGNSLSLLDQREIPFERIDGHGGKRMYSKVQAFVQRCAALRRYVKSRGIDVAFTQSSFYVPLVARAAGIPNLYTNDNEYAKGNWLAFLFADKVMLPEAMREYAPRFKFIQQKLDFYPGVKEGIYLSQQVVKPDRGRQDGPIYFRPEPWLAQYHVPERDHSCAVIRLLREFGPVTLLPRDESQRSYFDQEFSGDDGVRVVKSVLSLDDIISTGRLFVGAGGSMSRETAVLGLPTISVYSGQNLAVDDYLCTLGILRRAQGLETLRREVSALRESEPRAKATRLLEDGGRAFEQMYAALLALPVR